MKPYTQTIDRLYYGVADIRDYLLEKSRKMNQTIIFERMDTGERMTITPDRFDEGIVNPKVFTSDRKSKQTYRIVSFKWETDKNVSIPANRITRDESFNVLNGIALANMPEHHLEELRAIFNKKP